MKGAPKMLRKTTCCRCHRENVSQFVEYDATTKAPATVIADNDIIVERVISATHLQVPKGLGLLSAQGQMPMMKYDLGFQVFLCVTCYMDYTKASLRKKTSFDPDELLKWLEGGKFDESGNEVRDLKSEYEQYQNVAQYNPTLHRK